jgi:hypothetical protein
MTSDTLMTVGGKCRKRSNRQGAMLAAFITPIIITPIIIAVIISSHSLAVMSAGCGENPDRHQGED